MGDSLAPNNPTKSVAAAVKSLPTKETQSVAAAVKSLTKEKGVALNGLQALSQSYGDSDTGDSRESSPPSSKPIGGKHDKKKELTGGDRVEKDELINEERNKNDKLIDGENGKKNELGDEKENIETEEPSYSLEENKNDLNAKDLQQNKPPFKLKLKEGKQFIHNKFNIWSPITKGTLYPRAILNKCVLNNENDQSKLLEKKKKIQEAELSWKEERMQQSDKLFGPLQPPPPGAICKGSSSITSETSSTGSIQTQSGEWDVLDKPGEVTTPVGVEIKHNGGWN